jgi:hypothetical protein
MLRVQAATAVGPKHHLPSDSRLRVFVPGAEQTETRCVDFWHMGYDFASSCDRAFGRLRPLPDTGACENTRD